MWGSTIPPSWRNAAYTLEKTKGVVAILGDVDSGKSTLCTYLANTCLRKEVQVQIIDGDIGQADIGPPTTTSASTVTKNIFSLQELKPERSFFIGDTSPSSVLDKHVQSIDRLKREYPTPNSITIVNTDGWVREEKAIDHKVHLLAEIRPALVLGICIDHELDEILQLQSSPVLRLEASEFARTRTREERKKSREEGYRRFLENSRNREFRINRIRLKMFNLPQQQRIDKGSSHRGTLAGLLDENGALLSIGRIAEVRNETIRVNTATQDQPATIELGAVVLSSRFEEVGFES